MMAAYLIVGVMIALVATPPEAGFSFSIAFAAFLVIALWPLFALYLLWNVYIR